MATRNQRKKADDSPKEQCYPENPGTRPHVIVVGGGVAGMSAAHRLLERGHDVTLLEANSYLGGKLGAHQAEDEQGFEDPEDQAFAAFGRRECTNCTTPCCKADYKEDWHEHCYHMYLNWYHNFWTLMRDIGVIDRFEPVSEIHNLHPDPDAKPVTVVNPGALSMAYQNMTAGVASAADVFLHSQSLRDLLATPAHADRRLDQLSVEAFLREQAYTTAESRRATHRVLAKAFAAPTAMASASSYRSFVKYGARLPEPAFWLLNGHTEEAIFTPWRKKLASLAGTTRIERSLTSTFGDAIEEDDDRDLSDNDRAQMPTFTLMLQTRLSGIEIDTKTGEFLMRVGTLDRSPSPQQERTYGDYSHSSVVWRFDGQVVLTIPPRQLARLVHYRAKEDGADFDLTLAGADASLSEVTRLKGAPIMTLDVFFKKPLETPIPRGIVLLLDSKYEMSVYDNTQMWRGDDPNALTQISICASDADPLMPFVEQPGGAQVIINLLLQELRRYVRFDAEADVLHCRTHLQTNAGGELFVNAVDTWHCRPKTTTTIPDLFIAGDFVQTPIDVVTIEGAAMSGLMAAEAVRRRTGVGKPVPIVMPDTLPGAAVKVAADVLRPLAYGARMMSEGESSLKQAFNTLFPDR